MKPHRFLEYLFTSGIWWIRICGYGIHFKNTKKHPPLFSERYGCIKRLVIGRWSFGILKPVMSGWIDRTPFSPNPMSVKEWCDRTIFISTNDALGRRNFHREQWENSHLAKPWHEPWFPPDPDKKIRHRDVPKRYFQLGHSE